MSLIMQPEDGETADVVIERMSNIYGSEIIGKAICDPFSYALKLIDGEIIYFHEARPCTEKTIKIFFDQPREYENLGFPERGMEIFVDKILWIVDAPNGS